MTQATADIYVNGSLVRREPLPPGAFSLQRLPVVGGLGNVRVVVRDRLGREQVFGGPYYFTSQVLDKGTNEDQRIQYPYLAGYVALYAKDYQTAIAELQKADQRDPFILLLIAQAYEKSGDASGRSFGRERHWFPWSFVGSQISRVLVRHAPAMNATEAQAITTRTAVASAR